MSVDILSPLSRKHLRSDDDNDDNNNNNNDGGKNDVVTTLKDLKKQKTEGDVITTTTASATAAATVASEPHDNDTKKKTVKRDETKKRKRASSSSVKQGKFVSFQTASDDSHEPASLNDFTKVHGSDYAPSETGAECGDSEEEEEEKYDEDLDVDEYNYDARILKRAVQSAFSSSAAVNDTPPSTAETSLSSPPPSCSTTEKTGGDDNDDDDDDDDDIYTQYVINRKGEREEFDIKKIQDRIKRCAVGARVDPFPVIKDVVDGLVPNITTTELDIIAIKSASGLSIEQPGYKRLAARISISNLYKQTPDTFYKAMEILFKGKMISRMLWRRINQFGAERLNNLIRPELDDRFDIFGFDTLQKGYLMRLPKKKGESGKGEVVERPQYMYLRIALMLCGGKFDDVVTCYYLQATHKVTFATPTLCNIGKRRGGNASSCFVMDIPGDSMEGIFQAIKDLAVIAKRGGGVAIKFNLRVKGTTTSGGVIASGNCSFFKVADKTVENVTQGNTRSGAMVGYIDVACTESPEFVAMRDEKIVPEERIFTAMTALWMHDLFYKRVEEEGVWSVFNPGKFPELFDLWGPAFTARYEELERLGLYDKQYQAHELCFEFNRIRAEGGVPYSVNSDSTNRKSNQEHEGTINLSNLCTEITERTKMRKGPGSRKNHMRPLNKVGGNDPDVHDSDVESNDDEEDEYSPKWDPAVCNLGTISLPAYVQNDVNGHPFFNFDELKRDAYTFTRFLDRVIDNTHYPTQGAERNNKQTRNIGMGEQGLQDALLMLRIPYNSTEAKQLYSNISHTIAFATESASIDMAESLTKRDPVTGKITEVGHYATFQGSPGSRGLFQHDLWARERETCDHIDPMYHVPPTLIYDWQSLRDKILIYGSRNAHKRCLPPTASTGHILGNNETIDPQMSNIFVRRGIFGSYVLVNERLVNDLEKIGLWDKHMVMHLLENSGSVASHPRIPQELKDLYKTVWEITPNELLEMRMAGADDIDQSIASNTYMANPDPNELVQLELDYWHAGAKTNFYYVHAKAADKAINVVLSLYKAQMALATSGPSGSAVQQHIKINISDKVFSEEAVKLGLLPAVGAAATLANATVVTSNANTTAPSETKPIIAMTEINKKNPLTATVDNLAILNQPTQASREDAALCYLLPDGTYSCCE